MAIYKPIRKYYKYVTECNATIVGSATVDGNFIASNFSSSGNYIKTIPETFPSSASSFEMVICFKSSNISSTVDIAGSNSSANTNNVPEFRLSDSKLSIYQDGVAVTLTGSTTLLSNTWYWARLSFNGSEYKLELSTDGITYTTEATKSSTSKNTGGVPFTLGLGCGDSSALPFNNGSIDLSQSYIKINGQDWWKGTKEVPYETTEDEADYSAVEPDKIKDVYKSTWRKYYKYGTEPNGTIVGSLNIDDGVVSGFSASNYLQIPNTFSPTTNTWEMVFKVKTGTAGGWQYFIGANTSYIINVGINNDNKMLVNIGSGSWTVMTGTTTLQADTEYTFKVVYDGANYMGYVDDNLEFTVASSIVPNTTLRFGNDITITSEYWKGSIDFNQSYIKINNKEWWHGTKAYEVNLGGEDVYEDWTQPVLTSNGTMGGDKFAVAASTNESSYPPYKAFDGITSSSDRWGATSGSVPQWLSWYNPLPLKVTNIAIRNRSDTTDHLAAGVIQACDDNLSWVDIKEWTNNVSIASAVWNIDLSDNVKGYKYYRLYISGYNNSSETYVSISEMNITAQELVAVGSDSYDYSDVLKKRIVAVYKGSQLVYNLKYNLNSSSAYAKEGVVSGSDMFGADRGMAGTQSLNQTSIFTFNTPAPSGKYTGQFTYYSQVNFTMSQVYWRLTYEDGTQEYAYGPTSLGDTAYGGGETATVSLSFTAKKPIKAVTVYANGAGGGSGRYGGLGSIQMFFDGSKQ